MFKSSTQCLVWFNRCQEISPALFCLWQCLPFICLQSSMSTCEHRCSQIFMDGRLRRLHQSEKIQNWNWMQKSYSVHDVWCNMYSQSFTRKYKTIWKENLAVYKKSLLAFFPPTPPIKPQLISHCQFSFWTIILTVQ